MISLQIFNASLNKYKMPCLFLCFFLFFISSPFSYAANTFTNGTAPAFQQASKDQAINIFEEKKKLAVQATNTENLEDDYLASEQSRTNESAEEVIDEFDSLYKIELLIFAYVNTGEENSEIWRNPSRPSFHEFMAFYQADFREKSFENEQNTGNSDADLDNTTLSSLKKNQYTFLNIEEKGVSEFTDIIRKMKINGHYRSLQHLVWQQKVLEESAQDLFYVHGGNRYLNHTEALALETQQLNEAELQITEQAIQQSDQPDAQKKLLPGESEMEGTIHIYRSRFLHIKTNLWLSEYGENDAGLCLESDNLSIEANTDLIAEKAITSYTPLTNFRLNQHRRLRSGELHYLDHPRFGLLIKFSRVEKPIAEISDGTQTQSTQN